MDMRTDDELPGFRSLNHLLAYLERQGACSGALEAAPVAWLRYRRWRSRPVQACSSSTTSPIFPDIKHR